MEDLILQFTTLGYSDELTVRRQDDGIPLGNQVVE